MTRKFLLLIGLSTITAVALAFISIRIPFGIDPVDAVNIRNLQHTIGTENITGIRQGDLVLGNFNGNWLALFVKISNFSSLQFAQISTAWYGGLPPPAEVCHADSSIPNCGLCRVNRPQSTLLLTDGSHHEHIPEELIPLQQRQNGADGQIFVSDRVLVSEDGRELRIDHAGSHPPNHNFAPTPTVSLLPVRTEQIDRHSRGFAALTFGKNKELLQLQVYPGVGEDQEELRTGLLRAIDTDFVDERTHIHTVYASYVVSDDNLVVTGTVVTLPRCCSDPFPICTLHTCGKF